MKRSYSRAAPSPRYRRLIEQYQYMHVNGEARLGIPPDQTFAGQSLPRQAPHIKRLIDRTGARSILDYGSGKGQQYWPRRILDEHGIDHPDIRSYWGIKDIRCYDPAYGPLSELPAGSFDGVICTDVLEHCPEEDIDWIIGEIYAYATKFVFANVACFPARKTLPSGGNAHCTVKPLRWWEERIMRAAAAKPAIVYEIRLAHLKGAEVKERVLATPA